jgi:transcriptional regulator GlxA family with amidase domain
MPVPTSPELIRAIALTEETATAAPTFAGIARATGQSPRALARRFSEELGMTWSEALRRIRIIRAVEALAGTEAPVTEIALEVGYSSISAFNAAFRDLTGRARPNTAPASGGDRWSSVCPIIPARRLLRHRRTGVFRRAILTPEAG